MSRPLAALVTAAVLAAAPGIAGEHLASPGAAQERLREAAAARDRQLAEVAAFVASDDAAAALDAMGLEPARVQAWLAGLDDRELAEVAARVAALDRDPVAGAAFTGKQIGIVAAVILIVVFIIIIA